MSVANGELNAVDPQPWPKLQDALPKLSTSERSALQASIKDHGVLENGVYWIERNLILDGCHRKELSEGLMKWKGVNFEYEDDAFSLGLALNLARRHLSPEQIRDIQDFFRANELIQKKTALQLRAQGKTQAEAAAIVSVAQQTISDWEQNTSNTETGITCIPDPPDLRCSIPSSEHEKIYIRHAEGETQSDIADDYKVTQQTISNIISKERSRLSAHPKKENGGELGLFEGLRYPPKPWDVWNYDKDRQYGIDHPGSIPAGIIFNLLYFYTEPGDLIVDPMAGGGVVGDVCAVTNRRCLMFDINPKRPDIQKHDLTQGFPIEGADLIFLDPPYYKKLEDKYGPESISALSREEYLKFFNTLAETTLASGAKRVALLMSDYTDDEDPTQHIFIWDYVSRFLKTGWIAERHIMAPIPTTALHPDFVNKFRKSKKLGRLGRSLVIFRRPLQ